MRHHLLFATLVGALAACGDDSGSVGADATPDAFFDTGELSEVIVGFDAVEPDSAAADTAAGDGFTRGGFGAPCDSNVDCDSGWCVLSLDGYICTTLCVEACPGGFDCKSVSADGVDIAFICVPDLTCVPVDGPDFAGDDLDTNCDGIDGEVDNGVFVARNGDDDADGTITRPVRSIAVGVDLAVALGKRDVYVASGVYSGNVALAEGKGLFGGYSADFRVRAPYALETAILGEPASDEVPAAITCVGLGAADAAAPTIVRGFTVFGANAANVPGANSYAAYLRDCGPNLSLRDNRIYGGAGGNGVPGVPGSDGDAGVAGAPGVDAYDVNQFTGGGARQCFASNHRAGGAGGSKTCGGVAVSGGEGGDSVCPDYGTAPPASAIGGAGAGDAPGDGGWAGWDLRIETQNTANCSRCLAPPDQEPFSAGLGQPGAPGDSGARGAGCAVPEGRVVDGHWRGDPGDDGGDGDHGSGGGGGGSGGGVEVTGSNCAALDVTGGSDMGGSGGGGGSGGCLGVGGAGGAAGGGSFAIFMTFDAAPEGLPELRDNVIRRGTGGFGGAGGPGGVGGVGGAGAPGGASGEGSLGTFCAFAGGSGGAGGQGGHGGGGGGGCGGASYGLFVWPADGGGADLNALVADNLFEVGGVGGLGGAGGASLGASGTPGATGGGADTNF